MDQLNHEERRQKIARTAADVIAREGIDAATLRHIAARVGCSTTLITDCFDDKKELLLSAYRLVSMNTLRRFEAQMAAEPGNIVANLVSTTAIDEEAWCGWRVHVTFLERAIRDPALAAAQRSSMSASNRIIARAIEQGYGPSGDIPGLVRVLITLMHGISVQAMYEPNSWSREQAHQLLARQIETTLGRGPIRP